MHKISFFTSIKFIINTNYNLFLFIVIKIGLTFNSIIIYKTFVFYIIKGGGYTADARKLDGIFILMAPFSPPANMALLLRILSLVAGGKIGRVKIEITRTIQVKAVYNRLKNFLGIDSIAH